MAGAVLACRSWQSRRATLQQASLGGCSWVTTASCLSRPPWCFLANELQVQKETQPTGGGVRGAVGPAEGGAAGAGLPGGWADHLLPSPLLSPRHAAMVIPAGMWFGAAPALLSSAPCPRAPVQGRTSPHRAGDTPTPTVAVPAGVLWAQQAPAALARRLWQSPGATANTFGVWIGSPTQPVVHRVLTWRLSAQLLYGATDGQSGACRAELSLAGALPGDRHRQRWGRELAGSPRTGAGGSMQSQHRARVFPRATARGAAQDSPGESLFSSRLREFPPLPQLPPTPHAGEVPSFIWQHCPTQFAALLSLAPARALPAWLQLPPSH